MNLSENNWLCSLILNLDVGADKSQLPEDPKFQHMGREKQRSTTSGNLQFYFNLLLNY